MQQLQRCLEAVRMRMWRSATWHNTRLCSRDGLWNNYFKEAEEVMGTQWDETIWPIIKQFDFDTTLELAPGAGRNTKRLAQVARVFHAVDFNEYALSQLRARFKGVHRECRLFVHKNNGRDLKMIANESISTIYCWDAMVHFDKKHCVFVRERVRESFKARGPRICSSFQSGGERQGRYNEEPRVAEQYERKTFSELLQS